MESFGKCVQVIYLNINYKLGRHVDAQLFLEEPWSSLQEFKSRTGCNHDGSRNVYISKELKNAEYVFVRIDSVRKSLQQPYSSPCKVLNRSEKYLQLLIDGKEKNI